MERILIVEDDEDIQELLQNYLAAAGYATETAGDGEEALQRFHARKFDLMLLDLMLPKRNGYDVCQAVRDESELPIIMLTALDGEREQLRGFDLKIDDYVTKPFSMPVLLRKIEAVLRRSGRPGQAPEILYRALRLDLDGYQTYVGEKPVDLTQREFELLRTLLQSQGKVLSRQSLLNQIWGYDFYGAERVVDTHIKNLRKKLGADYIETIRGVGYKIEKEASK